uniref:Calponin-homology (CH) domain-containing protein n=1 Tax=Esox lucius TaxID=8010 RepID=A0A3P8YF72_ESOLU
MPAMNLDILPADEVPQPLVDHPYGLCADSGLEEGIGDTLAREQAEGDSDGTMCGLAWTLRCAVGEIHSDLQVFGRRMDLRLEEAAEHVAPLYAALAALQRDNLRLRIQQERLARQVEALCRELGLPEPPAYTAFEPKSYDPQRQPSTETPFSPTTPNGPDWEIQANLFPHASTFATCCSSSPSSVIGPGDMPSSPSSVIGPGDMPSSPSSVIGPGDMPSSPSAVIGPGDMPSSPSAVIGPGDMPSSPSAVIRPGDMPSSPSAVIRPGDMPSSPSAVIGPGDMPSSPSTVIGPGDMPSSPSAVIGPGDNSLHNSLIETETVTASEPVFVAEPSVKVACCQATAAVPNGSSTGQTKVEEHSGKLTAEQLAAIEDEELLDKMLDESKDFEERKMIRLAMRDLRKRKRDQREKEREVRLAELRQQRGDRGQKGCTGGAGEVVVKKVEKSADGSTLREVTKTDRFAQSGDGSRTAHSTITEASYVKKTDMGTVQSKSYSYTSSSSSSSARKVGSVFDREDDSSSRAAERRQAEKRKELMRAQTLPKTSAAQSRRAMIDKLEKESGGSGNKAVAKVNTVQRSASCMVPNANSIKQMLLDWCRAKTRSYENVDIQNFSSSWSDGMAFCALVHNFFPEAFDYSSLNPANRRHNFEVAFSTAEKLADCPELLDVEDMVRMREPDWKCVYTYLQEFYRGLATKGLVKTKNST